jgi:hypothetical protein
MSRSAETIIRDRLAALNQDVSAFSKIRYFGVKRGGVSSGNDERRLYADLRKLIRDELEDTSVRSPRSVTLIYKAFQVRKKIVLNRISTKLVCVIKNALS